MASIGRYGLKPVETGFPKIRNRSLGGCCCKHVLKVLTELKSNRILLILSKELERERNKAGFSNLPGTRLLNNEDLRLAQAQRLTKDAKAAFEKYKKEAEELSKKIKPRKVAKPLLNQIKQVLTTATKKKINPEAGLTWVGLQYGMTLDEINKIISDYGLR